jgi:uncharacterized protein YdgA (DUF945 family)
VKKLFVIVILLLALVSGLWGGAAYWFGVKAEQQYRVLLQQVSQSQYLKLVNESYSRGFFESKARTVLEIRLPRGTAGENQPFQLTLAQDIRHGPCPLGKSPDEKWQIKPVMATIETRLILSPETQSRLAELCAQIPELASMRDYTIIYLDGNGEEHLLIPAFQHTFGQEDKVAVDWKGLSLQVNFTADLKGLTGSLSMPGLEIVGEDLDLRVEDVRSTFNSHEGVDGLWLGEASFDVAGLEFADTRESEPNAFLIQGFSVNTSSKASGDNINCLVAVRTDQLQFDETQYGPGAFEMEFLNLDAASLARLEETVREQQAQPPQQSAEEAQIMLLARYLEILPGLLKNSPEIEVRQLDVKTSLGDFTGKAKLAFDGRKLESTQSLLALASAITAEAEFKVGERLLRRVATDMMGDKIAAEWQEQEEEAPSDDEIDDIVSARIDQQLEALMEQNILVKENEDYRASASYKAGQIVLNGRPLSLQNLMQ